MANEAFHLFDKIVFGRVLPLPTKDDVENIESSAAKDSKETAFIYEMMNALDAKTSALLTHISLIVAALSFFYTAHTPKSVFKFFVFAEIIAYLVLTIFCLRSIRMTSRSSDFIQAQLGSALSEELVKRRAVYNWASNATVIVTVFLILTLIISAIC